MYIRNTKKRKKGSITENFVWDIVSHIFFGKVIAEIYFYATDKKHLFFFLSEGFSVFKLRNNQLKLKRKIHLIPSY